MGRLIVNADDFGLTPGVNRAIVELYHAGVLTSTTLMAKASATEEAIALALKHPGLGVGCHVVLVDGEPVLSGVRDIPNVADPADGRFERTLLPFLHTIYTRGWGRKVDSQIEIEAHAQIQSLQSRGLRLTHIDTHKHTHMFPAVLRPLLHAAKSCGVSAVRNPFEPALITALGPADLGVQKRRLQMRVLNAYAPGFRAEVTAQGMRTTDGTLGVLVTGVLDLNLFLQIVSHMPEGTWEFVCHPGYNDSDLGRVKTRLRESRQQELAVLTSPEARRALQERGVQLISYHEL